MAIRKKPYEISVWKEELSPQGIKTETKGAIIGASEMSYLGRATNVKLVREVKGTNTLTFDMPTKFFNPEIGEYVKNELIEDLYNEQKIKLFYKKKWYEFYIKNIDEKKNFKSIIKSFTCKDSFIDELSRTGYGVAFNEELYNSVNELGDFTEEILEDSIWDYRADLNYGDFTEFTEERFYKIPLSLFGGSIKAYPVNLEVDVSAYNPESSYCKEEKISEKNNVITNIYTNKTRPIELGDDIAREREIFWDPYYKDNGFKLLDDEGMETLKGDYIYVPYTCLSFIYGSIYTNAYKATEEPAKYGPYGTNKGLALQPSSKDPSDLIQFIFFKDNDEVFIDEEGYVANNNCHYVIKIDQWNETLKKQIKTNPEDSGLIHWHTQYVADAQKTTKYVIADDGNVSYTKNVLPSTRTIDDFIWYPVYYEGYLDEINDTEVYGARKLSITDRTEFNLKSEYYCVVYNNRAQEYIDMYSEKEVNELIQEGFEPRVQSHIESRIVLPTLAKNLVQNGENITKNDGWEALTQNNTTEFDTGSYANLLEINVQSTTKEEEQSVEGDPKEESVSDYYLEIMSPNIVKCTDTDYEGFVSSDFALNFGMSANEINIEKDKVYAIRVCTGAWITDSYTLTYRNGVEYAFKEDTSIEEQDKKIKTYENTLKEYHTFLKNIDLGDKIKVTVEDTTAKADFTNADVIQHLKDKIAEHDKEITDELLKFNNCFLETDSQYLIYKAYEVAEATDKIPEDKQDEIVKLEDNAYEDWISNVSTEKQHFEKQYNIDLDKILIGQGSIDIDGNYTLSGYTTVQDKDKFISFGDLFEQIEKNGDNLTFVPKLDGGTKELQNSPLIKTLHHKKVNGKWTWEEAKSEIDIKDNAYLLFKAKANITTPYVGLKSESEPMTLEIENLKKVTYDETNMSGVKVEVFGKNEEDGQKYLVNNAKVQIYSVDNNTFSERFLNAVGWKLEESSEESSSGGSPGKIEFVNTTTVKHYGVDVSGNQTPSSINWESVANDKEVEYAILKIGDGTNDMFFGLDTTSSDNTTAVIQGWVNKVKKPFGVYWFSRSFTAEEAKKEAEICIQSLKKFSTDGGINSNFQLPVFYDIENQYVDGNDVVNVAETFLKTVADAGYCVGIYTSASPLANQLSSIAEKYIVWAAQHNSGNVLTLYKKHCEIYQPGSKHLDSFGQVVDIDYFYIDAVPNLHHPVETADNTAKTLSLRSSSEDKSIGNEKDFALTVVETNASMSDTPRTSNEYFIVHSLGDNKKGSTLQQVSDAFVGNLWNSYPNAITSDEGVSYITNWKNKAAHAGSRYNDKAFGVEQCEPGTQIFDYATTSSDIDSQTGDIILLKLDIHDEKAFNDYVQKTYINTAKLAAAYCKAVGITDPTTEKDSNGKFYRVSAHAEIMPDDREDPFHLWMRLPKYKDLCGDYVNSGKALPGAKRLEIHKTIMDDFRRNVKTLLSGGNINGFFGENITNGGNPVQDRINRENPNNDYTLKSGDLLSGAKPVWGFSTLEDAEAYFSALVKKENDICSYAYALFINEVYYGIFWIEDKDKKPIDDVIQENAEEEKKEEETEDTEGGEG